MKHIVHVRTREIYFKLSVTSFIVTTTFYSPKHTAKETVSMVG